MKDYVAAHIIVSGVVQGVGFRWFVLRIADKTGITGWVRNRFDGSVEIEAEGTRSAVETFFKEVRIGPRMAFISDATIKWQKYEAKYTKFDAMF